MPSTQPWPSKKTALDCFLLDGGPDNWTLSAGDQSIGFARIDADRPVDYQRVIPSQLSGEVAQFNPEYLARCQMAAHDLVGKGAKAVHVGHNGQSSALINTGCPEFVAVVMPLRSIGIDVADYAWVRENVATAPAPLKAVA